MVLEFLSSGVTVWVLAELCILTQNPYCMYLSDFRSRCYECVLQIVFRVYQIQQAFFKFPNPEYPFNTVDQLLSGFHTQLQEHTKFRRLLFALIPPKVIHNKRRNGGESTNDGVCAWGIVWYSGWLLRCCGNLALTFYPLSCVDMFYLSRPCLVFSFIVFFFFFFSFCLFVFWREVGGVSPVKSCARNLHNRNVFYTANSCRENAHVII